MISSKQYWHYSRPGKYFPLQSPSIVPEGTIFPAFDLGSFLPACDKLYNITTPPVAELRRKYKYTAADLRNSTRIIWSLAQYDPTSAVAPNQPEINAPVMAVDRNLSRVLYTSDMAHREDLFAPDPSDRESVVRARKIELESIKGWLGLVWCGVLWAAYWEARRLLCYGCARYRANGRRREISCWVARCMLEGRSDHFAGG
jgi:hypothetical protein